MMRIAAVEVSHWHSLHDSAYLRHLVTLPDVQLVGVQDPSAAVAAERAAVLGNPPVFTDYGRMLADTSPDFVIALGRHSVMAETAHYLLDHGYPFLMEKPMGINAAGVRRIADKAAAKKAFVAVPLAQRYLPFTTRARALLAEGRFGPLSHIYFRLNRPTSARYPAWGAPWMLAARRLLANVSARAGVTFNHVLVNRYRSGEDSMGLHSDDEPELGPDPLVAIVSLGTARRLVVKPRRKQDRERHELPLGHGALLVMGGTCQRHYVHGIPRQAGVQGERISLTFRHLLREP
jgi:predicted dehydrogenase